MKADDPNWCGKRERIAAAILLRWLKVGLGRGSISSPETNQLLGSVTGQNGNVQFPEKLVKFAKPSFALLVQGRLLYRCHGILLYRNVCLRRTFVLQHYTDITLCLKFRSVENIVFSNTHPTAQLWNGLRRH